jgi:hypothetical protein
MSNSEFKESIVKEGGVEPYRHASTLFTVEEENTA